MNAHAAFETEDTPIDRFDNEVLRRFRLRPMACVPDGCIVWCVGTSCIGMSVPWQRHRPAPPETNTACLSITDYRRVTKAIADQEQS